MAAISGPSMAQNDRCFPQQRVSCRCVDAAKPTIMVGGVRTWVVLPRGPREKDDRPVSGHPHLYGGSASSSASRPLDRKITAIM